VDFKAVGAGILKISKHERAKQKRKDETKSEYQNDLGRLRYVKESERMLLKSERDRTVEDERG
jgi:hypothetical protein